MIKERDRSFNSSGEASCVADGILGSTGAPQDGPANQPVASGKNVYIVDDDSGIRQSTYFLLAACGYSPQSFGSGQDFVDALPGLAPGCVLLDVRMPEIDGLTLLSSAHDLLARHPVIVVTGHGDTMIAVRAMKLGAADFIEKPFGEDVLLETIEQALARLNGVLGVLREKERATALVSLLTAREHEVLRGLLAGHSNKVIAFELGLSARTVEMHRAGMMDRLGVRSLSDALKIALTADTVPLALREPGPRR